MTFRIPSPGDIGAREFDGHPESYDAVNKNIPKGWIWFGSLIFDARSDAASCITCATAMADCTACTSYNSCTACSGSKVLASSLK